MKIVTRAFIIDQGKVLLGKRARKDATGKWALIGGRPEENEKIEDTTIREVQEELGLIFKPTFWMEKIDDTFGQGEAWKVTYFYGPTEGEININKDEISDTTFATEEDLESLNIAYDHKSILKKFFQEFPK